MATIATVQYQIVDGPSADDIMSKFMHYFDPEKYPNREIHFVVKRETSTVRNLATEPPLEPGKAQRHRLPIDMITGLSRQVGAMGIEIRAFGSKLDLSFTPGPRAGTFIVDKALDPFS